MKSYERGGQASSFEDVKAQAEVRISSSDVTDGLVRSAFVIVAMLSQVAAQHDLSLTQLRVLAILRDHEPKMAELAEHLGLDRSSVSGLVNRAVGRGLVLRGASIDDGRAVRVTLTPAGRRLAVVIDNQIGHLLAPMVGQISRAEQRRLAALLGRIVES
jgi:DNA-binding MarR family transcriptional regulator